MDEILSEYEDNPAMFDKIDFVAFMDKWLRNVKLKVDEVTYEGYKSYLEKHIKPYFEPLQLKLHDVKLSDIEDYYYYKSVSGRLDGKEGGLSYRSIKLHSVVLNLIFNEAMRQSLIKNSPCKYAQIPNTAKKSKKKMDFYTPAQCKKLLMVTKGTIIHDMIYITFMYGLRRSELMGLKWDAVDFDNDTIEICHTVVLQNVVVSKDKTKTDGSNRLYPLLPDVKSLLLARNRQKQKNKKLFGDCYNDTGYIFTKDDGSTYYPSYPTHTLQKILKNNELPHIRWHDLRYSTASLLVEKNWHMKDISEWLGHENISTTMDIYAKINIAHKRRLGNGLGGVLDL